MVKHQSLSNYLNFMANQYNIQLCFNDFTGFISIDQDLDRVLRPYMAHTNPYCMYIKSNRGLYNKCLALKKLIAEKSIKMQKPFYGVCHAGIGEYIIPVNCQGNLVGVINIGVFQVKPDLATYFIRKACQKSGLQEDQAFQYYLRSASKEYPALKTIANTFEIIADYLGNTYATLQSANSGLKLGKKRYNSSEDSILAHILEYINQNYYEPLTVAEIAIFCHCSESYINHLFKKRVGINIKLYINKIRVEHAQNELINSDKKVADIALIIGFNDSNYFSRVFSEIMSISPLEYRRRFS